MRLLVGLAILFTTTTVGYSQDTSSSCTTIGCDLGYDSSLPCQCNDLCRQYGNCCDDFIPICASLDSCGLRCFEDFNSTDPCHCNYECIAEDNCCDDFVTQCLTADSCSGRCDESFNPSNPCHCDVTCVDVGNCCDDYVQECSAPSPDSCAGRCDEAYDPSNNCHCDETCISANNCCNDYVTMCTDSYSCKGECNVTRSRCDCKPGCEETKTCCWDYSTTCKDEDAWKDTMCAMESEMQCPEGYEDPIVLLFSIDGFRASYFDKHITPNIQKIADCGVHARFMRSVFPTKTFPNHYSIATGLYPESHGIIGNTMYDWEQNEEFRLGSPNSFHPFWWGGEPIWNTVSNQGLKSACYFWPGSDVNITRYPDYYYKYDGSVPNEERMYTGLEWLDLPKEERPSFITLYMDIVDHAGHSDGPDSTEVEKQLRNADYYVGILMEGLKQRNLENCVNMIFVADHGMAPISCDRKSSIEDYGVDLDQVYFRSGPVGRLGKSDDKELESLFNAREEMEKLKCDHENSHWQAFLKYEYLPKRWHYANNARIEDILLPMDVEWLVEGKKNSYSSCNGGTHGYDNEFRSMNALFGAHGPAFKRQTYLDTEFANIELYNLMTTILNVTPAPNNGTQGSLYHLLSDNLMLPVMDATVQPQNFPYTKDSTDLNLHCTACQGIKQEDFNKRLESVDIVGSQALHLWFGEPFYSSPDEGSLYNTEYTLLTQENFVLGYDLKSNLPAFASATLLATSGGGFNYQTIVDASSYKDGYCTRPDVRLPDNKMTDCSLYHETELIPTYLLHPELSNGGCGEMDALISSNLVPMYQPANEIWKWMGGMLAYWAHKYRGINIAVGPIYDYNYDGLRDDEDTIRSNSMNGLPVPTHFFIIAIRCTDHASGSSIDTCNDRPEDIDTVSYVIPNYKTTPCHKNDETIDDWLPSTLLMHVARIRDVELLTGLSFLTKWSHVESLTNVHTESIRAKLQIEEFSDRWLTDFVNSDVSYQLQKSDKTVAECKAGSGASSSLRITLWACLLSLLVSLFSRLL